MTFTHVPASALTLHDHKSGLKWEGMFPDVPKGDCLRDGVRILNFSDFAERAACADCGTPLGMRFLGGRGEVGVCVGSVEDDFGDGGGGDGDGGMEEGVREGLKAGKAIFVKGVPGWVDVGGLGIRTCERFDGGV